MANETDVFEFIVDTVNTGSDLMDRLRGLSEGAQMEALDSQRVFANRVHAAVKAWAKDVEAGYERLSNDG